MPDKAARMTERQIQLVLFREFGRRAQVAIPNYTPMRWHECDLALVTVAGYFREYEIKLSVADFRADGRKSQKHRLLAEGHPFGPVQFWYVVPQGLLAGESLPPWAGLIEMEQRPRWRLPCIVRVTDGPRLHAEKASERMVGHMRSVSYFRYWDAIGNPDRLLRDRQATVPVWSGICEPQEAIDA